MRVTVARLVRLSAAIVLAMALAPAATAVANPFNYVGGADASPMVMLNDHTVYRIHFTATSGLLPNRVYHVNTRLTSAVGAGNYTDARGFTWNPTLQRWVHNRAWEEYFPAVTTDASGTVSGTIFFKVGDEDFSGFPADANHADNQAHLTVTLQDPDFHSPGGGGHTGSPSVGPVVTILNASTQGARVHNGAATGAGAAADAIATSAGGDVLALQTTEPNGVDDDDNGIVDDEDYGPLGHVGDFLFGVPADSGVDVSLSGTSWMQLVFGAAADTDVALGAADDRVPTSPTDLEAVAGDGSVALTWTKARDAGGSRLASYKVYRLTGSEYVSGIYNPQPDLTTAVPVLIAEVPARAASRAHERVSFTDMTAVNGVEYRYYVRAADGDTNTSSRSNEATAMPQP